MSCDRVENPARAPSLPMFVLQHLSGGICLRVHRSTAARIWVRPLHSLPSHRSCCKMWAPGHWSMHGFKGICFPPTLCSFSVALVVWDVPHASPGRAKGAPFKKLMGLRWLLLLEKLGCWTIYILLRELIWLIGAIGSSTRFFGPTQAHWVRWDRRWLRHVPLGAAAGFRS